MPQMMPINWMIIFFFCMICMLIIMMLINSLIFNLKMKYMKNSSLKKWWKWSW